MAVDATQGKITIRRVSIYNGNGTELRNPKDIHRRCDGNPQGHIRTEDVPRNEPRWNQIRIDLYQLSTKWLPPNGPRNCRDFPTRQNERDDGLLYGGKYPT